MTEFCAADRQNNVSLDDEISPEGIMTVSSNCIDDGVEVNPTLRHATQLSI